MTGENNHGDPATAAPDRRKGQRFPLRLSVWYRSIESSAGSNWVVGESVNISKAGLLFTTPEPVIPGQRVEALIAWPVFLDNHVPLKLFIRGAIVRSAAEGTAMSFAKYEFRTCRTPSGTTSRGL
jgi:hypothetical protein